MPADSDAVHGGDFESLAAGLPLRRLEGRNRRLLSRLVAWAEVLDALGWHVVLVPPGRPPWLGARARAWAERDAGQALDRDALAARLAGLEPARWLVRSDSLWVWSDGEATAPPAPAAPLTRREAEVLGWLREGKTGPEIAIILGCAPRTVESHVNRLYRKLGVHSRADLLFSQAAVSP